MENLKRFNVDHSGSSSKISFLSHHSSDAELNDLTSTFEELTIDVKGMVEDVLKSCYRNTDSIRQDFVRNGIDSALVTQNHHTVRPPPGFGRSKLPLANLDNQPSKYSASHDKTTTSEKIVQSVKRKGLPKENECYCVFCYNNHEEQETYLGHPCRDEEGIVVCPKLRSYVCPYCQATGDMAHTKKYCPKKPIITPDDLQSMASPFVGQYISRRNRNNYGKRCLRF